MEGEKENHADKNIYYLMALKDNLAFVGSDIIKLPGARISITDGSTLHSCQFE